MKLSVIIVNWNTVDLTVQAIRSVFDQTSNFAYEVVVIDNHSSDNSVEKIKKIFPQVIILENKENFGFGRANNQGMKIAKGEYLFLLNSDTVVLDGAINKLVQYLDTNRDVMMVGPRLLNADKTFQHACRRNLPTPMSAFYHLFGFVKFFKKNKVVNFYKKYSDDPECTEPVQAISGAAMMFRKEVYEKIGGFDEHFFMYGEDLDFCKRIYDNSWKTVYVSTAKIIHFGGSSSSKRRIKSLINFYDAMWLYYKKHFVKNKNVFLTGIVWSGIKLRMCVALVLNNFKK